MNDFCFNDNAHTRDRHVRNGYHIGRPAATQCQTTEQLEACGLIGVYENKIDAEDSFPDQDNAAPAGRTADGILLGTLPVREADLGFREAVA
jgi:hypothetical protein